MRILRRNDKMSSSQNDTNKPILGRIWPMMRTRKCRPMVLAYSFGDLIWRRRVAFLTFCDLLLACKNVKLNNRLNTCKVSCVWGGGWDFTAVNSHGPEILQAALLHPWWQYRQDLLRRVITDATIALNDREPLLYGDNVHRYFCSSEAIFTD